MGSSFSSILTQMFPPKAHFTEKDLPDLHGKVYIVTGSNTGVGKELARMLYSKNAKVYIAARSEERANKAVHDIKNAFPTSTGALVFLRLDLGDLATIKASAQRFLAAEPKLHVLFNNAGVQNLDSVDKAKTKQGYEIHIGVNILGAFLFTKLLTPVLISTARVEPPNIVRVVWVSSTVDLIPTTPDGLDMANLDYHIGKPAMIRYGTSKVGNWLQAVEMAQRYKTDGVLSIPVNPGNLESDLYRQQGALFLAATKLIKYPPVSGAYAELFAGLSPEITLEKTGCWVVPFGRIHPVKKSLAGAAKTEDEGGNGGARRFWQWNEEQIKAYL